jgi:hypothetical protein
MRLFFTPSIARFCSGALHAPFFTPSIARFRSGALHAPVFYAMRRHPQSEITGDFPSSLKGHKRDTKRSQTFLNLFSSVVRNRGIGKGLGGILPPATLQRDAPASLFLLPDDAASRKIERKFGIPYSTTETCRFTRPTM